MPAGYSFDMEKGEISGPDYRLYLSRGATGQVNTMTEVTRRDADGGPAPGEKANDVYSVVRTHVDAEGNMSARTRCQGERRLSSPSRMLASIFTELDRGNKRQVYCRTVTPKMCETLKAQIAAFGDGYRTSKFARACESYTRDLYKVFQATVAPANLPEGFLEREMKESMAQLKLAMKGDTLFDDSAVNLTHLLASVPPEKRLADARNGLGLFHDLMELEEECDVYSNRTPTASPAKGRSRTEPPTR